MFHEHLRSLCLKERTINIDEITLVGDALDFLHILLIVYLIVEAIAREDFGGNGNFLCYSFEFTQLLTHIFEHLELRCLMVEH